MLGLIAEQPRHGFAVRMALDPDGDVGRVWSLPGPLVYRALTTLQAKGLAEVVRAERSEVGPQRTLVTATPDGRHLLQAWLVQPVEHLRDFRSLFMLKLVHRDLVTFLEAQLITRGIGDRRHHLARLDLDLDLRHDG